MTTHSDAGRPVLVVIPTFRREHVLPDLVGVIRSQLADVDVPTRLAVIDNDPSRSAAETAASLGVEYHHEPTPGIAAVRHRGLAVAEPDDLVIMVDDDTTPGLGWLRELVRSWQETRAAVVVGFVHYDWSRSADPWIEAGGFMRRVRHPRHRRLESLATGNVLIDVAQVRGLGVTFDLSLGLLGGEDLIFGKDVRLAGGAVIACPDSVVSDVVPPERCTRAFVHRRAVGHGRTRTRFELHGHTGTARTWRRARAIVGGLARWVAFTGLRAISALTRNTRLNASATRRAWFAAGRVGGAFGLGTQEYSRPV